MSLIRDEKGYEQIAEKINEFEPDWLYIQPFVLNQLIRAYRNLNLEPANQIRYIESVGEILTSDLRRRAEEMFHVKATNMYGSEEMNGIAIENSGGAMHILTDNVFLEVKNEKAISCQGEGESIITNLNNFAMPLIRYVQGDAIFINRQKDISKVIGRSIDEIVINGKRLNTIVLCNIVNQINNEYKDIIINYTFLFIRAAECLTAQITCDRNRDKNKAISILEMRIKQMLPDINVDIELFQPKSLNCKTRIFEII